MSIIMPNQPLWEANCPEAQLWSHLRGPWVSELGCV